MQTSWSQEGCRECSSDYGRFRISVVFIYLSIVVSCGWGCSSRLARPGPGIQWPRWAEAGPARPRLAWAGGWWVLRTWHSLPWQLPLRLWADTRSQHTEPCDTETDTCETHQRSGGHIPSCEARCDDREAGCDDSLVRHVGSVTHSESVVTLPAPSDTVTHIFPWPGQSQSRDLRMPGPGHMARLWPGLVSVTPRAMTLPRLLHGVSAPTDGQHAGRPSHLWQPQMWRSCVRV